MAQHRTIEAFNGDMTMCGRFRTVIQRPSCLFALAPASPQRCRRVPDGLPLPRVMPIKQHSTVPVS
jgi:hypothetical protein